jgi:hypothetical protein
MPKYYFHVRDGGQTSEDDIGVELPNAIAAHHEATIAAREILAEKVSQGDLIDGQVFVVAGEDGRELFELPFRKILDLE